MNGNRSFRQLETFTGQTSNPKSTYQGTTHKRANFNRDCQITTTEYERNTGKHTRGDQPLQRDEICSETIPVTRHDGCLTRCSQIRVGSTPNTQTNTPRYQHSPLYDSNGKIDSTLNTSKQLGHSHINTTTNKATSTVKTNNISLTSDSRHCDIITSRIVNGLKVTDTIV